MAKISGNLSESLSEYLILPSWVKVPPEEVSLVSRLSSISLQYPFMLMEGKL